jgi:hypothetical protein
VWGVSASKLECYNLTRIDSRATTLVFLIDPRYRRTNNEVKRLQVVLFRTDPGISPQNRSSVFRAIIRLACLRDVILWHRFQAQQFDRLVQPSFLQPALLQTLGYCLRLILSVLGKRGLFRGFVSVDASQKSRVSSVVNPRYSADYM